MSFQQPLVKYGHGGIGGGGLALGLLAGTATGLALAGPYRRPYYPYPYYYPYAYPYPYGPGPYVPVPVAVPVPAAAQPAVQIATKTGIQL